MTPRRMAPLLLVAAIAGAGDIAGEPPPVIDAEVDRPGSGDGGTAPPTTPAPPIPCSWYGSYADQGDADRYNQATVEVFGAVGDAIDRDFAITLHYYSDAHRLHRWNAARGRFEQHQLADCSRATAPDGVSSGDSRWVGVAAPDPATLLPGTTRRATERIAAPAPSISPPDAAAVNLGLWLAVDDPGPVVARAELGPLWAETRAMLATTTFDLGTGDPPIVCPGAGTPLPADRAGSVEPGPCGATYRSVPDHPVAITVTATWHVTWATSAGTTGTGPAIAVTAIVPYEVYEIQTVGERG